MNFSHLLAPRQRVAALWRGGLILALLAFALPLVTSPAARVAAAPKAPVALPAAPKAPTVAAMTLTEDGWFKIGLDSNTGCKAPFNGPDTFDIGAEIANTGDVALTNIVAHFVFDTADPGITLPGVATQLFNFAADNPGTIGTPGQAGEESDLNQLPLAVGAHEHTFFHIQLSRHLNQAGNACAVTNEVREYHVYYTSTELPTETAAQDVTVPGHRELLGATLQNTNAFDAGTFGLSNPPLIYGKLAHFNMTTTGQPSAIHLSQIQASFPNNLFQVMDVTITYTASAVTQNLEWGDACVVGRDPTVPATFDSCTNAATRYDANTVEDYQVMPLGAGSGNIVRLCYDLESGTALKYCGSTPINEPFTITDGRVSNQAAAPSKSGGIDLQWTGSGEVNHLGYRVLRADSLAGTFRPVSDLITNPDQLASSHNYQFHDATGTATSRYQIAAVATNGTSQTVDVPATGKSLPALPPAPNQAQRAAQSAQAAAANRAALAALPHGPLTTTPYRLLVSHSGITRVTYEQLQAAGVPLNGVPPALLQVNTNLGPAGTTPTSVPLAMHTAQPNAFGPGDWFDFVGQAAPTAYGDGRAYYLSVGSSPGARMAGTSSPLQGGYPATFASALHLEENHIYWNAAPDFGAPQATGAWYWTYSIVYAGGGSDGTATLNVPNVDAGQPTNLTVNFQGFTRDLFATYEHHVEIYLNNTRLGELRWNGQAPQQLTFPLAAGQLQSGANTLRLHGVADGGAAYDGVLLDSADVSYSRAYQSSGDSLSFTAPGGGSVAVGGFSSPNLVLYDVTTPGAPQQVKVHVSGTSGNYTLTAGLAGSGTRQLLAAAPAGLVSVDSIAPVAGTDLHTGGADYLVIAYDSLLGAGQQLAQLHAAGGMSTAVVPVSAIYDQFGTGASSATAIAAFLATTRSNWSPAPHYVVLLGSANVDPHNYDGGGFLDLVPTAYVSTSILGRTASDVSLVIDGAHDGPQQAIGRIPARTPAEASAVVSKLASYETSQHQWTSQVALVADEADASGAIFDKASNDLSTLLSRLTQDPIYLSKDGST
ncbi:MAG TPA: C25 family cysteine peptidase, partial [Chloroflexia bacterium]|nr:C25 family cysteine peptidase [Chloroflexia bacterium]